MKLSSLTIGLAAAAALLAGSAQAAIVNGGITGGSAVGAGGAFVELSVPFMDMNGNTAVGNNTFQDPNFYAFSEGVFTVGADLPLDVGGLTAGQIVESHYVFFDPAGSTSLEGFINFDNDIIGIATSLGALEASDLFGNPLVTYLSPNLRGLENNDQIALNGTMQLLVDWRASTPGDFIRVFTVSDVPLPAAVWMFIAGFGGLAARAKAKKANAQ
ncbi:MAG: VPLPA-CTERM sorting domain-containing protein [Pseudomonadota bacterium]